MKQIKLSILFVAALLMNFACTEEKETGDQAPAIPPSSTMEMSLESLSGSGGRVATATNAANAVANIAVWNVILGANLIIPVAAFKAAVNQDPTFDETNSSWIWSYTFTSETDTYTAKLTGKFVSAGVQWDMYISKEGEYENVHWFTGTSNLQVTEGEWHLNYMPENPTPFIDINWSRESDDSKGQIKYTVAIPEDENEGSYIEYGIDTSLELDAYYNIHLSSEDKTIEIQWNRASNFGKIKNPFFFQDSDFHCWDNTWQDTVCE